MPRLTSRLGLLVCAALATFPALAQTPQFTVSFPAERSSRPIDGRLLLLLSTDPSAEPRMQIDDTPKSQIIFGTNVTNLHPGERITIPETANGYPIHAIRDVK